MNGTLESRSIGLFLACIFGHMALVPYYVFVNLSAHVPTGLIVFLVTCRDLGIGSVGYRVQERPTATQECVE